MTKREENKAKLRAAKEKVKRLLAAGKLLSAMNKVKLDWSTDYLSPEMKEGVQKATEKYLGPEWVGAVLEACRSYSVNCKRTKPAQQVRDKRLAQLKANYLPCSKRKRGRPPGTEDWCTKELVKNLAVIWLDAEGKLPAREQSRFGQFVGEIGKALDEGAWEGIVRDVLRGKNQIRSRSYKPESIRGNPEEERAALAICYDLLTEMVEKMKIEEEIRKLPGTEKIRKIIWDDDIKE